MNLQDERLLSEFAKAALIGLLGADMVSPDNEPMPFLYYGEAGLQWNIADFCVRELASRAYELASAMLAKHRSVLAKEP